MSERKGTELPNVHTEKLEFSRECKFPFSDQEVCSTEKAAMVTEILDLKRGLSGTEETLAGVLRDYRDLATQCAKQEKRIKELEELTKYHQTGFVDPKTNTFYSLDQMKQIFLRKEEKFEARIKDLEMTVAKMRTVLVRSRQCHSCNCGACGRSMDEILSQTSNSTTAGRGEK